MPTVESLVALESYSVPWGFPNIAESAHADLASVLVVHTVREEIMARIVQSLTQPLKEYDQQIQLSFVRDIDSVIQKLNSTFQQDLKDEAEAESFFIA